eukprot:1146088-Pelagomonas_calceolata.AAC.7
MGSNDMLGLPIQHGLQLQKVCWTSGTHAPAEALKHAWTTSAGWTKTIEVDKQCLAELRKENQRPIKIKDVDNLMAPLERQAMPKKLQQKHQQQM